MHTFLDQTHCELSIPFHCLSHEPLTKGCELPESVEVVFFLDWFRRAGHCQLIRPAYQALQRENAVRPLEHGAVIPFQADCTKTVASGNALLINL